MSEEKPRLQNIAVPEPLMRLVKVKAASEGKKIRELVYPILEALVEDRLKVIPAGRGR